MRPLLVEKVGVVWEGAHSWLPQGPAVPPTGREISGAEQGHLLVGGCIFPEVQPLLIHTKAAVSPGLAWGSQITSEPRFSSL